MTSTQLIKYLTRTILKFNTNEPLLVGIDGIDASGKTILANELAENLRLTTKRRIILSSIDGFHNQRAVRYSKGRNSPEGYYCDSFNYDKLKECLLDPLNGGSLHYTTAAYDHATESDVRPKRKVAKKDSILIMEGIFLFKPELVDYWDLKILLEIKFDTCLERVVGRKQDRKHLKSRRNIIEKYKRRYIPGQKLYFKEAKPTLCADIIIDNNDPLNPVLKKDIA